MERLFENVGSLGDLQRPLEPKAARANIMTHWVMAYDHKTQSFIKTEVSKSAWMAL